MPGENTNFVERVKATNLPLDKSIVIGSGILAAYGIRDARDIDVVVADAALPNVSGAQLGEVLDTLRPGIRFVLIARRIARPMNPRSGWRVVTNPVRIDAVLAAIQACFDDRSPSYRVLRGSG